MVNRKAQRIPLGGPYDGGSVWVLQDASFGLDGGAMFGVVPRVVWEQRLAPDAAHRIPLTTRCLLVKHPSGPLLVDVGMGERWDEQGRARFALRGGGSSLRAGLAAAGVAPEDVAHVVLSHLHFDHCGGLLCTAPDGRAEPAFPRATVYVQRRCWDWALAPSRRDRASFRREDFDWLEGSARLRLVDGETELLPGIDVLCSDGHTPGMQLVRVHAGSRSLIHAADLVPTQHHVRLAWHMGFDLDPLKILQEKERILGLAADRGDVLVLEHDPEVAAVRVERRREDFAALRSLWAAGAEEPRRGAG